MNYLLPLMMGLICLSSTPSFALQTDKSARPKIELVKHKHKKKDERPAPPPPPPPAPPVVAPEADKGSTEVVAQEEEQSAPVEETLATAPEAAAPTELPVLKLTMPLPTPPVGAIVLPAWQMEFINMVNNASAPDWMLDMVTEDLEPFTKSGITQQMLDNAMSTWMKQKLDCVARCRILDNQFSMEAVAVDRLPAELTRISEAVSTLCRLVTMPDVEFILCSRARVDELSKVRAPLFSIGKNDESSHIILIPDFSSLHEEEYPFSEADAYSYLYLTLIEYARLIR